MLARQAVYHLSSTASPGLTFLIVGGTLALDPWCVVKKVKLELLKLPLLDKGVKVYISATL
jgi:hypothetical protein